MRLRDLIRKPVEQEQEHDPMYAALEGDDEQPQKAQPGC